MDLRVLDSIYCPKVKGNGNRLNYFLPPQQTLFFAYGRQAFIEGLKMIGLKQGEKILLPEYICNDIPGSLKETEIEPVFYRVNKDLTPDYLQIKKLMSPFCKTLLIVNYFGFPQPWEPIKELKSISELMVIEDNAHGFLSKDKDCLLGFKGDIGIFSLRKTIALPNGGALVVNNDKLIKKNAAFEKLKNNKFNKYFRKSEIKYCLKECARPLMASGGGSFRGIVLNTYREAKKYLGIDKNNSLNVEKQVLEECFSYYSKLLLCKTNFKKEIKRRRVLYFAVNEFIKGVKGCTPLYNDLAAGVVPYGYPFYCHGENIESFQKLLLQDGLISVNWPELPSNVASSAPEFYKKILLIPFLW
tara:strand:+ start:1197 stop:2270 length:1074 start_codon:yes stop_codon:yes gene_type:complete